MSKMPGFLDPTKH